MRRPGWLVNAQHHVQWSWQRHSQPPLDVTTNESLMRINLEWPNDPILMVFVLKNIVLYKFSNPSFKNLSHSNYRVVWTLCETKSGEAFGPENAPFEPCLWRVRIKNSEVIHGEQEGARYPWGDSQFGNPYGYPIFTKVFDTVDLVPGGYQLYGIRTSSFTSQSFEDCFPCQTHILAKCFVPRPWILWSPHQRQPRCPKNGWGTFGDAVDAGKLSGSLSGSGIWSVFGKQIFFSTFRAIILGDMAFAKGFWTMKQLLKVLYKTKSWTPWTIQDFPMSTRLSHFSLEGLLRGWVGCWFMTKLYIFRAISKPLIFGAKDRVLHGFIQCYFMFVELCELISCLAPYSIPRLLHHLPSGKLTQQWKIPILFSIGNASSEGPFSIAMLVYQRVFSFSYLEFHSHPWKLMISGTGIPPFQAQRWILGARNLRVFNRHLLQVLWCNEILIQNHCCLSLMFLLKIYKVGNPCSGQPAFGLATCRQGGCCPTVQLILAASYFNKLHWEEVGSLPRVSVTSPFKQGNIADHHRKRCWHSEAVQLQKKTPEFLRSRLQRNPEEVHINPSDINPSCVTFDSFGDAWRCSKKGPKIS